MRATFCGFSLVTLMGLVALVACQSQSLLPEGEMVLVPAGTFMMGSDDPTVPPGERPAREVSVDRFWMDVTPVTNREFARFVAATGYVTTAEKPVDWNEAKKDLPPGTPRPPQSVLNPGSLVFQKTRGPVDLRYFAQWWRWTSDVNWRQPEGPGSSIDDRDDHPVVQVSWHDAQAYAKWAGKRLPTEAEWEYAARGGLAATTNRFIWGDEFKPDGKFQANTWTGDFPYDNTATDGYTTTSPVGTFPPNSLGLYDMAGNVWNWVVDRYPHPSQEQRVIKGGSFLCHVDYCESYRPTARMGNTPETSTNHTGFRCVRSTAPPTQ